MVRKRIAGTITDAETGEQRDAVFEEEVRGGPKPAPHKGEPFVMTWMEEAVKHDMTVAELRVLAYLAKRATEHGEAIFWQTEIAEALTFTPAYVYRVLRAMEEKHILIRRGTHSAFINPAIMWKGQLADRNSAIFAWGNRLRAHLNGE